MEIVVKIKLSDTEYFNLDTYNNRYIQKIQVKQELDADIESIIAPSSANEIRLVLDNKDGLFTTSNTTSPLYQKLKDGVELEIFVGVELLGTYYIKDYLAPTSAFNTTCSIRAVDRLQNTLNSFVDIQQIHKDLSMKAYLTKVFKQVGFQDLDIVIDESLSNVKLNYTLINGKKLSEIIGDCSIAGDFYCYISRDSKVVVKPREIVVGTPLHRLTEKELTYVDIPQNQLNQGNTLKVGYVSTSLSEIEKIVEVKGIKAHAGVSKLDNYTVDGGNLYEIDNIRVSSKGSVRATEVNSTQSTVSITLNNPTLVEDTVDIEVYGKTINTVEAYVLQQDTVRVVSEGENPLDIRCDLIQDRVYAESLLSKTWTRLQEPLPYIIVDTQSKDFLYDLGELISVVEPIKTKLIYQGYIHSLLYDLSGEDGIIDCKIGIKKAKVITHE